MELKELIDKAVNDKEEAYQEYVNSESADMTRLMAYYMKMSNIFTTLIIDLQKFV